eukprot:CAMPEP_0172163806 /NCGR_PEP_ID=MMETSP1050-20130122/7477_1 /TAXON_ID=233186 /ORGANISM="Cryptomonas curvata, Strain CCAP979/52" /LENGTH=252 /DNA_ID=CAMNT_0012834039 /DNA_START=73 /DNA_END=827 /DNA_ORIENTATION=+
MKSRSQDSNEASLDIHSGAVAEADIIWSPEFSNAGRSPSEEALQISCEIKIAELEQLERRSMSYASTNIPTAIERLRAMRTTLKKKSRKVPNLERQDSERTESTKPDILVDLRESVQTIIIAIQDLKGATAKLLARHAHIVASSSSATDPSRNCELPFNSAGHTLEFSSCASLAELFDRLAMEVIEQEHAIIAAHWQRRFQPHPPSPPPSLHLPRSHRDSFPPGETPGRVPADECPPPPPAEVHQSRTLTAA